MKNLKINVILFWFCLTSIFYSKNEFICNYKTASAEIEYKSQIDSTQIIKNSAKIEAVPILMYDTDIGFGYGGKAFFLNQFDLRESIDVTLFNSTKGERWYRLVFSIPDFEVRQRKTYPISFDLVLDYDKMIKNNFFGVGNNSKYSDKEIYTKEPIEAALVIGRGFTNSFIGQAGLKYKNVRSYNYELNGKLLNSQDIFRFDRIYYSSFFANFRYDTRDSYINPSLGTVFGFETEVTLPFFNKNISFTKWTSRIQQYIPLFNTSATLALRVEMNNLVGNKLPVQMLLPLGGGGTLRGFSIERYLDKNSFVANAEVRSQLIGRLSGIIGLDSGNVFSSFTKWSLRNLEINSTIGLRLFMDTFVIRMDVGLGRETTGFYINFGQMF